MSTDGTSILSTIDGPSDLKGLRPEDLPRLAQELRTRIIEVVSRTGGHLAPSLGVVELAVAIHYVFDSPRDRIIWDVGHQCYAHKLLTGRRDGFERLRQLGGISGFPRPEESEHDAFATGHSSTSISAALGMACARDLNGEDAHIVAVVGDGALSAGLAFEGLNQAGDLKRNMLVVLNDNEMSISRNVGALAKYLTRLIATRFYRRLEEDVWEFLGRIPGIGGKLRELVRRVKEGLHNLVVPTILFEELGFKYFGPVDGHDLNGLIHLMRKLRMVRGPVLMHVLTVKGKGYRFAEENSSKFHGIGAFDKTTGSCNGLTGGVSFSEVFGRTAVELARQHSNVVAVTAAMTDGTGLKEFAREFPRRFFDVGIAEQHAVTFAAGMAAMRKRPIVAIYSTFLQRAYDQIIHDVAIQRLPVVFAIDRAGIVGEDGPTHHGSFDISYLRCVPNLVSMAPKDGDELVRMLYTAMRYTKGPVAIRYPRASCPGVFLGGHPRVLEIGRGEILKQGTDVALIAIGSMVTVALEAARSLEEKSISAAAVNARFISPLDEELIQWAARGTGRVVTLEENSLEGGFGSAVLEAMERRGINDCRVLRIGIPDRFVEQGSRKALLCELGLDAASVVHRVTSWLQGRKEENVAAGSKDSRGFREH